MSEAERQQLAGLPERVTIYRGVNDRNGFSGLSWTLDLERAERFARRFLFSDSDFPGVVVTGRVLQRRIIALFQVRNESEVVAEPRHVYHRSERPLADR